MHIRASQGILLAFFTVPGFANAAEIVDVSISHEAGCAVRDDGALFCFGHSSAFGEDHDGALKRLPGVSGKRVAVSGQHVCFIDLKGEVRCAGSGDGVYALPGGQAPAADDIPDPTATSWRLAPGVADAVQIATGRHHTCALTKAGDIHCWGSGYYGRLGPANADGLPAKVPGLGVVTQLTITGDTTCVLSADKKVRCFGDGWSEDGKQVKDGEIGALKGPAFSSVGGGFGFACGLAEDGLSAVCAGRMESFTGSDASGSQTIKLPEKASRLLSGTTDLCFIAQTGKVVCSGTSQSILARTGELEVGAWSSYPTAVRAASFSAHEVLAIGTDGSLMHAGGFDRGPKPLRTVQRAAVSVLGLDDVVELAAGAAHVCARRGDGTVSCWGGSWEDSAVPRKIAGLDSIAALDAGGRMTCARHTTGKLTCFATKHVANAPSDNLEVPSTQSSVVAVAVGESHACSLDAAGNVSCWGSPYDLALGYKPKEEYPEPVKRAVAIAGLSGVTQIEAGSSATCALTKSFSVRCWGRNTGGILGNGGNEKSALVADVVSLPEVTKIEMGPTVACALGKDQRAHCWGTHALTPIPWPGDANVIDVAAGGLDNSIPTSGACIVRATGRVECGLPGSARTVKGVEGATSVTAGSGFACALLGDKTVKCWGKRDAGQLGDGRPPITTTFQTLSVP